MALIKQAMKGAEQEGAAKRDTGTAPKRDAPAPQPQAASGEEQPTPEEQAAYERVVMAGLKAIYDQKTHGAIVNMLKSGDPPDALAQAAETIVLELDRQSGGKIPEVVILPAAAEILGELAQLAGTANIFQPDERTLAVATQKMVVSLCEQYGVEAAEIQELLQSIPKEQIEQYVQQQSGYAQQGGGAPPAGPAPAQPAVAQ